MKVLLIDVNYKQGSTGKIVSDLRERYLRKGHEVIVCYGRGSVSADDNVHRISPVWEMYLHVLLTRLTGLTGCFSFVATRRLLRLMKRFQPDAVHLHELHGYYLNIGATIKYLKKHGIPAIWTYHCEFMYTGKCGYSFECEQWRIGCGHCPQVREYPKSLWFDRTAHMWRGKKKDHADWHRLTVATVSRWLADRVGESPILAGKQLAVVYNGVNTDIFFRRPTDELRRRHEIGDRKVILHVTPDFNNPVKGGQYVISMARHMAEENVLFIVVGTSGSIENCPPNLRFVGRIENQEELASYYSLADCTILPSKKETFSMICAESLCCGTPVVGFESGAPSEVAPVPFGTFVSNGDEDSLHARLMEVIHGSSGLADSAACSVFAHERYNKDRMAAEYLSLYTEVGQKKE